MIRSVKLTRRETEILHRLSQGATTAAISRALGIRDVTVRNHIQSLLKKLGAHTRLQAIRRAEAAGLT